MVITRGKGESGDGEEGMGGYMVMEGDLTWGGEYTIQYANDLL